MRKPRILVVEDDTDIQQLVSYNLIKSGFNVTCALHGAQFDVRDGSHKGPPAYCGVRSFPVAEGPEGVVVTVASKKSGGSSDGPPSGYYQTR